MMNLSQVRRIVVKVGTSTHLSYRQAEYPGH